MTAMRSRGRAITEANGSSSFYKRSLFGGALNKSVNFLS